jgi:hypothetical protein
VELALGLLVLLGRHARRGPGGLVHQAAEQLADLQRGQLVVDGDVVERVERHRAHLRIRGLLHDRRAAAQLDRPQPGGAVVQRAGQDHADHARAVDVGRRAEQRIDRRPETVLLRAARDADRAVLDQHVMVVGRHVDAPRLDAVAILRIDRRQRPGLGQDLRQHAPRAGREVPHDEHRPRKIARQPRNQLLQRLHPPGGGPDYYDVLSRHPVPPAILRPGTEP